MIAESPEQVEEERHTGLSLPTIRIRHGDALFLGAFVVCITALNQLWLTREHRPPHWDKARHLLASLQTKDAFGSGFHWLTDFHTYPPLVYWTADLFYALLGTTASWAAVLSQSVFLGILTFSTYGIGRRLWGRRVGLLAAVFVVLSPMLISLFKDFMLDPPLTAMTALALYLLIRCEYFSLRAPAVLLGVACGFGLLTKWNFVLYLALPIAYAVLRGGRYVSAAGARGRVQNVALAAATTFVVAAPWYLANVSNLRHSLFGAGGTSNAADIYGIPPVVSVDGALWYFWNLVSNQLYLIPFLLLVVGIVFLFLRPEARSKNLLLVLTIVGSYVLCSLLRLKDDRYTLPMLPAVAVVATYWLDGLRPRLRGWLVGGFLAYAFFTFAASSFGIGAPKDIFVHLGKSCRAYPYFVGRCPGSHVLSGTLTSTPSGDGHDGAGLPHLVGERLDRRPAERRALVPGADVPGGKVRRGRLALVPGASHRLRLVQRLRDAVLRLQVRHRLGREPRPGTVRRDPHPARGEGDAAGRLRPSQEVPDAGRRRAPPLPPGRGRVGGGRQAHRRLPRRPPERRRARGTPGAVGRGDP